MRVKVEQRHIDAARIAWDAGSKYDAPGYCAGEWCPIALAMAEAGFDSPWVCDRRYAFTDGKNRRRIITSRSMRQFVKDFDAKKKVKPFVFTVTLGENNSVVTGRTEDLV